MARRKRGSISFPFVALPRALITSAAWQELPHAVRVLVLDLAAQYTGANNGRLTTAWVVMSRCGWKSRETLATAKKGLLETEFAMVTRKGHPPRTAEWVGLTWWKLDYHQSMDVDPKAWPYCKFLDDGSLCSTKIVSMKTLRHTKIVPMGASTDHLSVRKS